MREGISSVLLALKRRPFVRHQRSVNPRDVSPVMWRDWCTNKRLDCLIFVDETRLDACVDSRSIRRRRHAVALAVDLSSHGARDIRHLVHERVDLTHVRSLSKDLRELVLSAREVDSSPISMVRNYGDLARRQGARRRVPTADQDEQEDRVDR